MTQLREEMEALLEPRRAYAATAYGYIDPRLSYRTRCYVADSDTTDDGVLLEIQGRGAQPSTHRVIRWPWRPSCTRSTCRGLRI